MVFNKHGEKPGTKVCRKGEKVLLEQLSEEQSQELSQMYWMGTFSFLIQCSWHQTDCSLELDYPETIS